MHPEDLILGHFDNVSKGEEERILPRCPDFRYVCELVKTFWLPTSLQPHKTQIFWHVNPMEGYSESPLWESRLLVFVEAPTINSQLSQNSIQVYGCLVRHGWRLFNSLFFKLSFTSHIIGVCKFDSVYILSYIYIYSRVYIYIYVYMLVINMNRR